MRNDSNPKYLWNLVWILGLVLVVKLVWVTAEWLIPLPVSGVDHQGNTLKHSLHYRYRLASDAPIKSPTKKAKTQPVTAPRVTLDAYRLVAIYSTGKRAIVTLVRGSKSFVLSNDPNGGEVEGYHLKEVTTTTARFQKGDDTTLLRLYEKKLPASAVSNAIQTVTPTPKKPEAKKASAPIVDDGDTKRIDRSLIQEYTQNPEKIWKNIGLYEVKSDGKLDGFKVRFVRRGTPFEKLGLKRGDIIKAINGEPIVDYATPMRMLKSADTIDDLSLIIERNHEEQELKYEVK